MVSGEFGKINPINELMNMKPKQPITFAVRLGGSFDKYNCQTD